MSSKPVVLMVGTSNGWREELVRRAGEMADLRAVPFGIEPPPPVDGMFVELDEDPAPGLRAILRLRELFADAPIVVVAGAKDPDLILRSMRAGAGEFLLYGEPGSHVEAVQRIAGRRSQSAAVITCLGARGGVGATAVAVNLAAAIAAEGSRVAVVDLDFQLGDVLLFLDLDQKMTIAELLENEDRLDSELLLSSLPRHGSGIWALSQAGAIEGRSKVAAADIPRVVEVLHRHFDYLVLDGVRGFDDRTLEALDVTNHLLLVLTQEIQSVKNAQLCLEHLRHIGFEDARVKLVVNRVHHKGAAIELGAIEEFLGRPVTGRIANDYPVVSRAISRGRLLQEEGPRSQVARDIEALAALITGYHEHKRGGGLLKSLFGHKEADAPAAEER